MNLTPAAIVLIAAVMLLGIAGQWSESLGAFGWWRLLAGALAAGALYELIATARCVVTVRCAANKPLRLGRRQTLSMHWENASARPLTLRFVPLAPPALRIGESVEELAIGAGASAAVTLTSTPAALGGHAWREQPIRIKGPLRLAWWSRRAPVDADLRVLPDTLGPRGAAVGTVELGGNARGVAGGAFELHHLRAYRPGDPRHTIDWKATARTSRLITRVYSEDQHLQIVVLLDAGRTSCTEVDGMTQFGHYANLAARFAEYCVSGDDEAGLIAFADEPLCTLRPARGVAAVTRIRRALESLAPRRVESEALRAAAHVERLVRHRCLAVFLTDLYERSATSQLAQCARLLAPKHFAVFVGLIGEELLDRTDRPARAWLDPYRGLAAREYERHVGANVARLQRLGAHAMTARPGELDRKVLGRYAWLRAQRRI
jgi:uncharacterized protein (DUF58 family)